MSGITNVRLSNLLLHKPQAEIRHIINLRFKLTGACTKLGTDSRERVLICLRRMSLTNVTK
jgi:hypothetical protein